MAGGNGAAESATGWVGRIPFFRVSGELGALGVGCRVSP